MTTTSLPALDDTPVFDALAELIYAVLDHYHATFRVMPEPLLDALPCIYPVLRSDDEQQHMSAYWRLQETLRQCGIELIGE